MVIISIRAIVGIGVGVIVTIMVRFRFIVSVNVNVRLGFRLSVRAPVRFTEYG